MNSKRMRCSKSVTPRFARDAVGLAKDRASSVLPRGVSQLSRSCVELFENILSEVSGTPREATFAAVLRHLSKVDATGCLQGQRVWNVIEHLVHRTVLLQGSRSLSRVSQSGLRCIGHFAARINGGPLMVAAGASFSSTDGKSPTTAAAKDGRARVVEKSSSVVAASHQRSKTPEQLCSDESHSTHPPAPPPLPPPLPSSGGILRAPSRTESECLPDGSSSQTRFGPGGETGGGGGGGATQALLPQQKTPLPRAPMKRLQWTKIPAARVASCPGNVWAEVADACGGYRIDFDRMEELFSSSGGSAGCVGGMGGGGGVATGGKARGDSVDGGSGHCEKKSKRTDEINLIDSKRSMNVSIFLRQFRTTNFDIISCLRAGESSKMGPERLRSLLKILPEADDVQLLQNFDGDRGLLGSAEKFYLELISLPDHRLLAEALLMKEEFPPTIDYIKPAIDAIILSARDIKDCKALHEIMYAVVMAGNFLNSGVYSGNAAGFQLQSLLKLSDLRSNKPRLSLLHFVAQETEERNPHLMEQLKGLKYLSEASQYSIELLLSEISTLQGRVRAISGQLTNCGWKFQDQMKHFLEMANAEMEVLEFDTKELEDLRLELAAYFCEDVLTFKLDDCISTFNNFCKMFVKAIEENKERHLQDMRAEERRRLREEQIASKRRLMTVKEPGKTAVTTGAVCQTNTGEVGQQNTRTGDRRIMSMPAFLQETSQPKRNSDSNFTDGGRMVVMTWPPAGGPTGDPEADDDDDAAGQNELLLNALLKAASSSTAAAASDETDHRRPASQRQRRRSRVSVDLYDARERASSPTAEPSDCCAAPGKNHPRNPHPPLLLHQRYSCPGVTAADAAADDSAESPGVSDAEANAKQERENRRMERRRRSQRANSSAACRSTTEATTTTSVSSVSCSHHPEVDRVSIDRPPQASQEPEKIREKETEAENREVARTSFVTGETQPLHPPDGRKRPNSGQKILDRQNVCNQKSVAKKSHASKSSQNKSPLSSNAKIPPDNNNHHKLIPSSVAYKARNVFSRADGLQKDCDDDQKGSKIRSNRSAVKHSREFVPPGNKRTLEKPKTEDWLAVQTEGTPSKINASETVDEVTSALSPERISESSKNTQKTVGPIEGEGEVETSGREEATFPSGMDENGSYECDAESQSVSLKNEIEELAPKASSSDLTALDCIGLSLDEPPPDHLRLPKSSESSYFDATEATSKSAAGVYVDEGIDLEAASLSSASQRASLCSTVESDIRVTPPMTRKDYDEDGGRRGPIAPARTSSIENALVSKRSSSRSEVSPRDISKQTTPKSQMTSPAAAKASKASRDSAATASGKTTMMMTRSFLAENQLHKSPSVESSVKIRQKTTTLAPKSKTSSTSTTTTTTTTAKVAARYKIAKPNFVSCNGDSGGVRSNPGVRLSSSATSTSGKNAKILSHKSKAVPAVRKPTTSLSVAAGWSTTRQSVARNINSTQPSSKKTLSSDEKVQSNSSTTSLGRKLISPPPTTSVLPPGETAAASGNSLGTLTGDSQKRRGVETATQRSTKRETTSDTKRVSSHSAVGTSRNVSSFASVLGSKRSSRSEIHTTP